MNAVQECVSGRDADCSCTGETEQTNTDEAAPVSLNTCYSCVCDRIRLFHVQMTVPSIQTASFSCPILPKSSCQRTHTHTDVQKYTSPCLHKTKRMLKQTYTHHHTQIQQTCVCVCVFLCSKFWE